MFILNGHLGNFSELVLGFLGCYEFNHKSLKFMGLKLELLPKKITYQHFFPDQKLFPTKNKSRPKKISRPKKFPDQKFVPTKKWIGSEGGGQF